MQERDEHLRDDDPFTFIVEDTHSGIRLDHLLAQWLEGTSRSLISSSIRTGTIVVDGANRKAGYKVKTGEKITGSISYPAEFDVAPEPIDFPILFEDEYLLVLSKPPGLVVHPGSGNPQSTLVNGLVHHCNGIADVGDPARPGIVHRLDKDTSGLMVVAKQAQIHRKLVDSFKNREVEKTYVAIVHGIPSMHYGRIVAPIGRHPVHRQKMAVRELSGRYAASSWEVVATSDSQLSRVKVRIETGRTHQIRVHMAHIGHPVAGDILYGSGRNNKPFPRQMLHAWRLSFVHPVREEKMRFTAPLWDDMDQVCKSYDFTEDIAI